MSTHLRYLAEYELDDIDEKLTGMQPDTLDELRAEQFARQDREDDHAPHTSTPAIARGLGGGFRL